MSRALHRRPIRQPWRIWMYTCIISHALFVILLAVHHTTYGIINIFYGTGITKTHNITIPYRVLPFPRSAINNIFVKYTFMTTVLYLYIKWFLVPFEYFMRLDDWLSITLHVSFCQDAELYIIAIQLLPWYTRRSVFCLKPRWEYIAAHARTLYIL